MAKIKVFLEKSKLCTFGATPFNFVEIGLNLKKMVYEKNEAILTYLMMLDSFFWLFKERL